MSTTTIRVSKESHARLAALAAEANQPMTVTLDQAIEELERQRFFAQVNARYQELRNDPQAWREIEAERALWDNALLDGLD